MIKVNAAYDDSTERHDIPVKFVQFAGGERHVAVEATDSLSYDTFIITAHMTSANDFFDLCLTKNAIESHLTPYMASQSRFILILPYVPYARQDRVCAPGQAFSIKVFANLINSLGFDEVQILDPHSDVTPALIDNCLVTTQSVFVDEVMPSYYMTRFDPTDEIAIVSPDAGAIKKAFSSKFAKGREQIVMHKVRDPATGKIDKTDIVVGNPDKKICIIMDDIIDGGRTFTEAARVLKERGASKVYLCVTHGIFSKGITPLVEHLDGVITTNSFLHTVPEHMAVYIDSSYLVVYKMV